jgi:hypothetical protein
MEATASAADVRAEPAPSMSNGTDARSEAGVSMGADASSEPGVSPAGDANVDITAPDAPPDVSARSSDASDASVRGDVGDTSARDVVEAEVGPTCGPCVGPVRGQGAAVCENGACVIHCNAGLTLCGGDSCVDLQSDAADCGRCGHSCQGGACTTAQCQPITIAPASFAMSLAVDASFVYWAESQDPSRGASAGSIRRAPIGGGGTFTLIAGNQPSPSAIAVNASGLLWINLGTGGTLPGGLMYLAPGAIDPIAVATAYSGPAGPLALSATQVYWFDNTPVLEPGGGSGRGEGLLSLPLTAQSLTPTATPTVLMTTTVNCVIAMALNATNVFFTQSGCTARSGLVQTATLSPLAGPTSLLPAGTFLNGPYTNNAGVFGTAQARMAVDARNVYFASTDLAEVLQSIPLAGGGPTTLSPTGAPNGVAVDGAYVYWTDVTTVNAIPIGGGAAITLASGQATPYDIVLDANSVYWTNYASPGTVMKVAKP